MHHSWPAAELGEPSRAEFCGAGSSEVELNQAKLSCRACSSEFPSRLRARMSRIPMEILWTFQGRAERSSAEPEPSSAEHFPIAHFWTQPSNGFQWILWSQGHAQTVRSRPEWRNSGTQKCHSGHKNRDQHPTQKDSESAILNSRKLGVAVSDHFERPGSTFWRPRPRSSGKCWAEPGQAPEQAPASF